MKQLSIVLLAAAAVALVLALTGRERGARAIEPGRQDGGSARPIDAGSAEGLDVASARTLEAREADAPAAGRAADPVGTSAASHRRFRGTVVATDELGAEHPLEDGFVALALLSRGERASAEVAVERGAWSLAALEDEESLAIAVEGILLGGRAAVLEGDPSARIELALDAPCSLRARWVPDALLSVRAADDGRELAPVLLVEVDAWPLADRPHPGVEAARARDVGPSPVRLDPEPRGRRAPRTVFARSPGYAWGRIRIDPVSGGERVLELERAATLVVRFRGDRAGRLPFLRLRGEESTPHYDEPIADRRSIEVEGLAPGAYRVAVELGEWFREPLALDEARVELAPGASETITLALDPPAPDERVPFAGLLVLPAEWELGDFRLEFELLDASLETNRERFALKSSGFERDGARADLLRWTAPDSVPGRYEVELRPAGFSVVVELPATGTTTARVEVPPPCEVVVRCFDRATGALVEGADPRWRSAPPENSGGWTTQPSSWNPDRGGWELRAPEGEILVTTSSVTHLGRTERFRVRSGLNELELLLDRVCGLRPVLRDGRTTIPWDDSAYPELEPVEGQEELVSFTTKGGSLVLRQKQPGLYRLKVPRVPGYEPVPDAVVRLEFGVVTDHVIELRRER